MLYPEASSNVRSSVRRVILLKFSYSLFYRILEENQIERRSNHSLITNRYRARILSHISPRLLRQIAIDIGLTVEKMLESR